ncbi:MAG: protein-L-isoaspartate(D-aspartate) O-methyltransferase [Candidatus Kerfeldbacteria bacterium]|nr:protein-L-isoaspartate(D-aspartate) O-methyltransferase [Candidatus Kerfeldbacteria bacterium]
MKELKSNTELVNFLVKQGDIKSPAVRAAFKACDRAKFVPKSLKLQAYENYPLPIGLGQTISQPGTVAFMLELLGVSRGMNILEVGAGSGYVAALLAELVGSRGRVTALEIVPELAAYAKESLKSLAYPQLTLLNLDGSQGYVPAAPYDRILVSAAAPAIPQGYFDQLKERGKLVMPIGVSQQALIVAERVGTTFVKHIYPGYVFVPLVSK